MTRRNSRHEPPEVAALFNPALIALLLARSTRSHLEETSDGLPFLYAPIIVTICLHPTVRSTLSMNIRTQFATWVQRSAGVDPPLQARIAEMVPIVNEGVLFALIHDILKVERGVLAPGTTSPTRAVRGDTADMEDAQKAAVYLGRWIAHAGSQSTVCAMLGVRP